MSHFRKRGTIKSSFKSFIKTATSTQYLSHSTGKYNFYFTFTQRKVKEYRNFLLAELLRSIFATSKASSTRPTTGIITSSIPHTYKTFPVKIMLSSNTDMTHLNLSTKRLESKTSRQRKQPYTTSKFLFMMLSSNYNHMLQPEKSYLIIAI